MKTPQGRAAEIAAAVTERRVRAEAAAPKALDTIRAERDKLAATAAANTPPTPTTADLASLAAPSVPDSPLAVYLASTRTLFSILERDCAARVAVQQAEVAGRQSPAGVVMGPNGPDIAASVMARVRHAEQIDLLPKVVPAPRFRVPFAASKALARATLAHADLTQALTELAPMVDTSLETYRGAVKAHEVAVEKEIEAAAMRKAEREANMLATAVVRENERKAVLARAEQLGVK